MPMLEALPGETLFSLCSRHHRLWGFASSVSTCQALFDGRRAGVQHDLPNSLASLEVLTLGAHGSAAELALDRTVLKFYAPFLAPGQVENAVTTMASRTVAHLKFRLGLLTSRFRAHHPLKACEACLVEDVRDHGWAYWHLAHQFPGIWACPWHGESLREYSVKANGVERFMWHLPSLERLQPQRATTTAAHDARCRLAELIYELVQMDRPAGWLQASTVQATLRSRMKERGWLTAHGQLRLVAASREFSEYLTALGDFPDLAGFDVSAELARAWIGRMARPLRSGTHPLRQLMLIGWLFNGTDDFVACNDKASPAEVTTGAEAVAQLFSEAEVSLHLRKTDAIQRLQAGRSARSVAATLGIDVGTAMAWGAAAGIAPKRRPKTLVPQVREALTRALKSGRSKQEAATTHDVSIQTITRLLRTEPGLRAAWEQAISRKVQREHRAVWTRAAGRHPGVSTKLLRAMSPATFAWLYRHDREWLKLHSPATAAPTARRSPVRWDKRDSALSADVRRVALQLQTPGRTKPVKLWEIVQQLPELRAKLAALRRLPLTAKALDEALGRSMQQRGRELLN